MNISRSAHIVRKDLRLGPRSPIVLWALIIPLAMTALVRGVFGDLFDRQPSLGIVTEAPSMVADAAVEVDGIAATVIADRATLLRDVADGRLDAGIVIDAAFEQQVRAGDQPSLEIYLSGSSVASDRALLLVTVIDLVRTIDGSSALVDVDIIELGDTSLPLDLRLLPLLVIYAVAIPGGMVPASSLVEEKERGTLQAVLTSPASMSEILLAKGSLGVLLGSVAGLVTLTLNNAYGSSVTAVTLAVLVGAVMMAQVGLIFGSWAQDTNTLFAAWKAGGLVIFLPVIFFIGPALPSWPGQVLPAWYFLQPTYAVAIEGATLSDVATELAIGAAICVALLPAVAIAGRTLEHRLVGGPRRTSPPLQPDDE